MWCLVPHALQLCNIDATTLIGVDAIECILHHAESFADVWNLQQQCRFRVEGTIK